MKLLIDDAHLEEIKKLYACYPIDGVTTNPSILARSGRNPYEVLTEIRSVIKDGDLHVQVISQDVETILKEAEAIRSKLGKETFVKIPVTVEGLRAMRILHRQGVKITATAIYSTLQAYLAAKEGADYVAPYVNRIDNLDTNGIETVKDIAQLFKNNHYDTSIIAASFKNAYQVFELCRDGITAATIDPSILWRFINTDVVSVAVGDFRSDFEKLCGQGKNMSNL